VRHVRRGGAYLRVADRDWDDPLSSQYALRRGGRWNPPASFGVVYLNASVPVARAQVRQKLEDRGVRPEDLQADEGPVLVHTTVPEDHYVDVVTDRGCTSLGLPSTYPVDKQEMLVPHSVCQPIGQRAWEKEETGIACRSAAGVGGTSSPGEELAFFARRPLKADQTEAFADWYW
jgi:RES domain-containing protein